MLNIHYQLSTYIQIYTYINLRKSQLHNRIDKNYNGLVKQAIIYFITTHLIRYNSNKVSTI
jgi:hypothetical protein